MGFWQNMANIIWNPNPSMGEYWAIHLLMKDILADSLANSDNKPTGGEAGKEPLTFLDHVACFQQ